MACERDEVFIQDPFSILRCSDQQTRTIPLEPIAEHCRMYLQDLLLGLIPFCPGEWLKMINSSANNQGTARNDRERESETRASAGRMPSTNSDLLSLIDAETHDRLLEVRTDSPRAPLSSSAHRIITQIWVEYGVPSSSRVQEDGPCSPKVTVTMASPEGLLMVVCRSLSGWCLVG